jgi:hypothetical protein
MSWHSSAPSFLLRHRRRTKFFSRRPLLSEVGEIGKASARPNEPPTRGVECCSSMLPAGTNPLTGLACDLGDQLGVIVVVMQRESAHLGSRRNKQIWDPSSPLAARCQEALQLPEA